MGQTKDDILLEAGTFARIPVDVVEWRVDWFEDVFDTDKVLDVAKDLQTVLKDTPILFTVSYTHLGSSSDLILLFTNFNVKTILRKQVKKQRF